MDFDEDEDDYRNYYDDDDDDDVRNAWPFRRKKRRPLPARTSSSSMTSWRPSPPPAPQGGCRGISSALRNIKVGEAIELGAQFLTMANPLPTMPTFAPHESAEGSLTKLVEYHDWLARYAKRNEQYRALGIIARTLLK